MQDDYAICLTKNTEIGTGNTIQFQLYFYILKYIIVSLIKELIFLNKQEGFLQN